MRRLTVALALLCSSCRSKHEISLVPVEATERPLTSVITTSDPLAAIQLLSGFHRIEQNSWRWTAARFAVALKVPPARPGSSVLLFLEANVPG
ncbi:MAG TPA: hypothetical protein VES20_21485, partial [Bryobacteraceae bacterium]|nr:hypothetical protein [Bryobacteraceae bacterium]